MRGGEGEVGLCAVVDLSVEGVDGCLYYSTQPKCIKCCEPWSSEDARISISSCCSVFTCRRQEASSYPPAPHVSEAHVKRLASPARRLHHHMRSCPLRLLLLRHHTTSATNSRRRHHKRKQLPSHPTPFVAARQSSETRHESKQESIRDSAGQRGKPGEHQFLSGKEGEGIFEASVAFAKARGSAWPALVSGMNTNESWDTG